MSEKQRPVMDQELTRRDFLRNTRNAAIGLFGLQFVSPTGSASSPDGEAEVQSPNPEVDAATRNWGELLLVDNEPAIEGGIKLPPLLISTAVTRFRKEVVLDENYEERPAGTVLEITPGEEDFEALGYRWTGGNVVYTDGLVQDGSIHEYTANNIGNTKFVSSPDEITPELQEKYRMPPNLPDSDTEAFDTEQFASIYNESGGDPALLIAAATAWGETIPTVSANSTELDPTEVFKATALDSWKRSVAFAAGDPAVSEESSFDICTITGEGQPCNMYRRINQDTGEIEVINRFKNPTTPEGEDDSIYAVTKFSNNSEEGLQVTGTSLVTAESLVEGYGKEAETIAKQTTSLSGGQVFDLVEEIQSLPQSKVFLAGLESGPQLASKVPVDANQTIRYHRIDSEEGQVHYMASIVDQENPELSKDMRYFQTASVEGVWMPIVESIEEIPDTAKELLRKRAQAYSEVFGGELEDILSTANISIIESSVGKDPIYLITTEDNSPLIVGKLSNGEIQYKVAQLKDIAEQDDVRMGVELHPNDTLSTMVKKDEFSAATMTYWWKNREKTEGTFDSSYDIKQAAEAEQIGAKRVRLGHVLSRFGHPDWLLAKSAAEVRQEVQEHVKKTVKDYVAMGVTEFNIVNEPFNSDEIATILGRDNYVLTAFQSAIEARNEIYAEMEAQNEEKPSIYFGLSHADNHISGEPGHIQSIELLNLLQVNGVSPDYLDLHFHRKELYGRPSASEFTQLVKQYKQYKASDGSPLRVVIGEYDVYLGNNGGYEVSGMQQGQVYYDDISAMLAAGIKDITFWGARDSESWYETGEAPKETTSLNADALLFKGRGDLKASYFQTGRALVNHMSPQRSNPRIAQNSI